MNSITPLLSYTLSSDPSPLQISTDTPTPGVVTLAVSANANVLCKMIVIKVPLGPQNDDLYSAAPTPTISSSSADWAPTLEEPEPDQAGTPTSYHTFTLTNNNAQTSVDKPFTVTIKGNVNGAQGGSSILLSELSAPVSTPTTFSVKATSFALTKAAAPAFYLRNFVSSAPNTPTVPATEFTNGTAFQLNWESNGTFFRLYEKGQTQPVYEGTGTAFEVKQGQATATTYVLVATLKDATLIDTLTVTITNPSLTPTSVGIGGSTSFRLGNTKRNIVGADGYGGNPGSLAWEASQDGYVGQFYNAGSGGGATGVVVKIASATAAALDVSQGTTIDQPGTPLLRVNGNGRVGIGITTPSYTLDVNGVVNAHQEIRSTAVISNAPGSLSQFGPNDSGFFYEAGGTMQFVAGGHRWMMLNAQGCVALGTGNPVAKLHVSGNGGEHTVQGVANWFSYRQITPPGLLVHDAGATGTRALAAYFDGGEVWVNSSIVSGQVSTASDARIKRILGQSDATADLARLRQLQITDYTYLDPTQHPSHVVKKVVAQQVQQVYPEAVSSHAAAVPNVYEVAAEVQHAAGRLTVRTHKPHELPTEGGRMRLYTPKGQDLHVEATVHDAHTFSFASEQPHDTLFVYGKYVSDFLSVDYDALAMLNVSATQGLARQVEELQEQNAALRAQYDAQQAAIQELQAQMLRLLAASPQVVAHLVGE